MCKITVARCVSDLGMSDGEKDIQDTGTAVSIIIDMPESRMVGFVFFEK